MARKVLIIWGAAGGGHRSGMEAVRDALLDLDPSVEVTDIDSYSPPHSYFPLTLIPRLYAFLVDDMPWAWHLLFRRTDSQRALRLVEWMTARLLSPVYERTLREFRPDIVVCVIHSISGGLKRAMQVTGQVPPFGMVVQDMVTLHQVWLVPEATWFALPTEEAQQLALDSGIPAEKLRVTGLPLRKMFWQQPSNRAALRRALGVPEEGPLTLVVGGAGVHKLERIVGCLIDAGLPGHIAVVAVNNSGTQGRLAQKARHRSLSVVGHVSNMSDWMWASDVMITKAGPNTIYEAMRCRLPMILTDAIPGQETGNISFVEAHGMGIYATRPAEIAAAAQRILSDDATAEPMKQAMDRMCRADAAQQIAKMLIG